MVERPENHFQQLKDAGADRIIVHQEATSHLHLAVGQICELGIEPGVAVNPGTSLSSVEEVISEIGLLLIMTVNPGWGGQPFIPSMLEKVSRARERLDRAESGATLEVDGGIKSDNAALVVKAGADQLVAGSAVYNDSVSVAEAMGQLRSAVSCAYDPK